MKGAVLCLALLLAVPIAADEEAASVDDFDDLEVDDGDLDLDDSDMGGAGSAAGGQAVEDFDLNMPEEDQRKRMKSCFSHTMNRVQLRKDELQATVQNMMSQQRMGEDQAVNALVFTWMMTCYMNIDSDGVRKVSEADTVEMERDMFGQRGDRPQQANQASRRQWKLLEEAVQENAESRGASQGGGYSDGSPTPGFSGQSGAVYVVFVFLVIFGMGAIVVLKLVKADQRVQSEKEAKKAEKAEKKDSRKKK